MRKLGGVAPGHAQRLPGPRKSDERPANEDKEGPNYRRKSGHNPLGSSYGTSRLSVLLSIIKAAAIPGQVMHRGCASIASTVLRGGKDIAIHTCLWRERGRKSARLLYNFYIHVPKARQEITTWRFPS